MTEKVTILPLSRAHFILTSSTSEHEPLMPKSADPRCFGSLRRHFSVKSSRSAPVLPNVVANHKDASNTRTRPGAC